MNGGRWGVGDSKWSDLPHKVISWGVAAGVAPSGSFADNGAVTLGTALDRTYSQGIWLGFPADAIYAGSAAGVYWCKFSDTTAGTVYNTVLGSNIPYTPDSDIAFSCTGPGAYTGLTTEVTVFSTTIPGGSLGPNGSIEAFLLTIHNNSAGGKKWYAYLGSTEIASLNATTSVLTNPFWKCINNGSQARQWIINNSVPASSGSTTPTIGTEDTSVEVQLKLTVDLATATDWQAISGGIIKIIYAP